MKILNILILIILCSSLVNALGGEIVNTSEIADEKPVIEVVFCLDATGSMSGLIHTAKEKIWDIVTVMTQAEPAPELKLGMIFYRDLDDLFVTKLYPLTEDIDSIYAELLQIDAAGGGDTPESVNQALHEAVSKISWGKGAKEYRTIFLVGDCPPHMDYEQDIKYKATCRLANKKGIVINTIKLGSSCTDAIKHFKAIAEATNGVYQQLGQDAGDVIVETPYDDSISYYSNKIDASKIYYGSAEIQAMMNVRQEATMDLYKVSSKNAVASRAQFSLSKSGAKNFYGENELVQKIIDKEVKLEDIKKEDLPENMKKMSKREQEQYVEGLIKERGRNISKLQNLTLERQNYIEQLKNEDPEKSSFSEEVFEVVKKQTASKGIVFVK